MGLKTNILKGVAKNTLGYQVDKKSLGFTNFSKLHGPINKIRQFRSTKGLGKDNMEGYGLKDRNVRFKPFKNMNKQASVPKHLAMAYGTGLAGAAATGTLAVGAYGASKLYDKLKSERIWWQLKKENPELTKGKKAREDFEALQHFSPEVASNISSARSFLKRTSQTDILPHEFVKDLSNMQDNMSRRGLRSGLKDIARNSRFDFSVDERAAAARDALDLKKKEFDLKYPKKQGRKRNRLDKTRQ